MPRAKQKDPFWTSYSDLMTSLFFVMLVLFIIGLIKVGSALADANATTEQLKNILQLEEQFKTLSQSSSLGYDEAKKMFYAKDFVGIEIFESEQDKIKPQYLETVAKVGRDLHEILKSLSNENFTAKAPADVVEKERAKQKDYEEKRAVMAERLRHLAAL